MLGSPVPNSLRSFLCITLLLVCHPPIWAGALAKELPAEAALPQEGSGSGQQPSAGQAQENPAAAQSSPAGAAEGAHPLPSAPGAGDQAGIPVAEPEAPQTAGHGVRITADQQTLQGDVYTLTGNVTILYRNYTLRADRIRYDRATGVAEAEGHLQLEGGPDDELITADHGTVNLDVDTARLYDVTGVVGARSASSGRGKVVYTGVNPFIFSGRVVIKFGPEKYKVIDGTMTSCRLPRPDWRISAGQIESENGVATARNAIFRLGGIPILYLPYVTHPVEGSQRQSGLLIPIAYNSSVKGIVLGEQGYVVLNRSMDMTLGAAYYSKRGWSPAGEFRYRGRGEDFVDLRFTALFDRGVYQGGTFQNQGGQDVLLNSRYALGPYTRAATNAEYLSSFVYREAFAESFAQAVASQVNSDAYVTHNRAGYSEDVDFARYISYESVTPGNDIVIAHLPDATAESVDKQLGASPVLWQAAGSVAGLSRHEPFFRTAQEVGRMDAYPQLLLPLRAEGWVVRPELAVRNTFYSKSQAPTFATPPGVNSLVPIYRSASANRKDVEAGLDLRPPVLERDFAPGWLENGFGRVVRHTIEPEIHYRYVAGISNFQSILRFDPVDVASDTNEVEFSLTQRLYLRRLRPVECVDPEIPEAVTGRIYLPPTYRECAGDTDAWVSWRVAQKHFFDPEFGGAVVPFRRNVLTSTLDFTGISFLEGPRSYSPVISRLYVHTNRLTDFGWDLDYDPRTSRTTESNAFADFRHRDYFGSVSHIRLNALNAVFNANTASQVTSYNQIRLLAGYGAATKPGLSMGANAGYDLQQSQIQYGGVEMGYNWSCCGVSIEYRRLALGPVRNENFESFNFTLAGIGTAGNINRASMIY
jgi:LPS-assembly protein